MFLCIDRAALKANPPMALTESYVTCTDGQLSAFANALGLAFADTSALLTVMPLVFIPIIFFALKALGYPAKENQLFSDSERSEVYELLANAVLMECDGIENEDDKNQHMKSIVQEIVSVAASRLPHIEKKPLRSISNRSTGQRYPAKPQSLSLSVSSSAASAGSGSGSGGGSGIVGNNEFNSSFRSGTIHTNLVATTTVAPLHDSKVEHGTCTSTSTVELVSRRL